MGFKKYEEGTKKEEEVLVEEETKKENEKPNLLLEIDHIMNTSWHNF